MRVEERTAVAAPREQVWDFITDPANVPRYMSGITRWEVQGERERGLGARYTMRLRVRSAEIGGLVEVVEYDQPGDMAWTNVTGVDQRGRWRLRERPDGGTDVTFRLSYQAPGGLAGVITDRLSEPTVRARLRETLKNLKRELEGAQMSEQTGGPGILGTVANKVHAVRVLAGAGMLAPTRPDRAVRSLLAYTRWGPTPAAGFTTSAIRYPHATAIVDELGTLSFEQVHLRTNALAHSLADAGIKEGDSVAVMCRNHRGFIETTVALSKLGASSLFLNTAFAGPQLTDVVKREKPVALVYDQEFGELLEEAGRRRKRFVAWCDDRSAAGDPVLEDLIESGDREDVVPPAEPGRTVILTSGTTGTPKGASRKQPETLDPAVALLSRIPLHAREVTHIAAPLFHSWGFAHFSLGLALSSTYSLQRKFDPERTLAAIEEQRASVLVVVPVMLQRIMELDPETIAKYDTSSLKAIPASGSALPGELARRVMDQFGDVLYNLYGSTEVAWATIATPAELRAAPGTAGSAPRGTVLRIYDEGGVALPPGQVGRIFVGNEMLFEGYTGGGGKDTIDGLMSTGDVGYLDEAGRLFVEGRDDEMIVSGGENVFPKEVEDTIADLDGVVEVAVIGVDDEQFGQRLKAFVVKKGDSVTEDSVKSHVKASLARFKVPREVEFLDELPRNATGKVLKRELA